MVPPAGDTIASRRPGCRRCRRSRRYRTPWRPAQRRRGPGPGGTRTPLTGRPSAARTMRLVLVAMRDWWLRVSSRIGLDELGLDGGGADGEEGLPGEDGRALRHRPDVAGEAEGAQIVQKVLAEAALCPADRRCPPRQSGGSGYSRPPAPDRPQWQSRRRRAHCGRRHRNSRYWSASAPVWK